MCFRYRAPIGLMVFCFSACTAWGQSVVLTEDVKPGKLFHCEIALTVEGKMKIERNGKPDTIPLKARATHTFVERVESLDGRGGIGRVIRHYHTATSEAEAATDRSRRAISPERRLIVAQRSAEGNQHFNPDGPLFREELELVAEHFDTLCLPALLPGKEIQPGDTWKVTAEAAQHACLFEGLIKADLTGKLTEIQNGTAHFEITGTTEGIESGANAKLTISAKGKYSLATKQIVELVWEQTDDRGQGPASPASEVQAKITLKRSPLSEEPKELNSEIRGRVPEDGKVPALLMHLRYHDAEERYQFVYPRDWHVVGRTRDHLVLRLLDKGEFTAQATLTTWKKADPGQHSSPEDFKKVLGQLPGWEPEQILEDGTVPTDPGRWMYRVSAKGKQDGLEVIQTFHLLAGPAGDQIAVTVLAKQDKAAKVTPRDLMLVTAIEFPTRK